MASTKLSRARPSPSKSPWRKERKAIDTDDEARYVVTVRSAKNLKRQGFRGLTNPYCKLNVGRQGPFMTDVVYDSTNPSWENKKQTFEFRKGNSPQEDKLSLACFNSGDVPELIGRLNVTLSPANHKVITLPMFRKELGGSQVWAGSVEIELHFIPEGESSGGGTDVEDVSEGSVEGSASAPCSSSVSLPLPAPVPAPAAFSPLGKATIAFPGKAGEAEASPRGTIQAELLSLSPRMKKRAEFALAVRNVEGDRGWCSSTGSEETAVSRGTTDDSGGVHAGGSEVIGSPEAVTGRGAVVGWKMFFAGVVCSAALVLGVLLVKGGTLSGRGVAMKIVEDGRQTVIVIDGSNISRLRDRHLVVMVGDEELCRVGAAAPSPETEGSAWAFDLSHSETSSLPDEGVGFAGDSASATSSGEGGDSDRLSAEHFTVEKGRSYRTTALSSCGPVWSFVRRLTAPLDVAKRGYEM